MNTAHQRKTSISLQPIGKICPRCLPSFVGIALRQEDEEPACPWSEEFHRPPRKQGRLLPREARTVIAWGLKAGIASSWEERTAITAGSEDGYRRGKRGRLSFGWGGGGARLASVFWGAHGRDRRFWEAPSWHRFLQGSVAWDRCFWKLEGWDRFFLGNVSAASLLSEVARLVSFSCRCAWLGS